MGIVGVLCYISFRIGLTCDISVLIIDVGSRFTRVGFRISNRLSKSLAETIESRGTFDEDSSVCIGDAGCCDIPSLVILIFSRSIICIGGCSDTTESVVSIGCFVSP